MLRIARGLKLAGHRPDEQPVRIEHRDRGGMPALGAFCAALVLALLACGASGGAVSGAREVKTVRERDFAISAPRLLTAGNIVFRVHNRGPDAHELIVVRSRDGRLPLRADGLTVDEERVERDTVGVLEPGSPGGTRLLRLHLTPGTYVLFCNMSGHYLGGMRSVLVVRR